MYCEDLSPWHYDFPTGLPGTRNIGWLGPGFPCPTGEVSSCVLDRLDTFAQTPAFLTRGFHCCHLCQGPSPMCGNGELWLHSAGGLIYVAPQMLPHYIREHRYLPPAEFLAIFDAPVVAVGEKQASALMERQRDRLESNPTREDILIDLFDVEVFWKSERFPDLTEFGRRLRSISFKSRPLLEFSRLSRTEEAYTSYLQSHRPSELFDQTSSRFKDAADRPFMYRYRLVYLNEPWTVVES